MVIDTGKKAAPLALVKSIHKSFSAETGFKNVTLWFSLQSLFGQPESDFI